MTRRTSHCRLFTICSARAQYPVFKNGQSSQLFGLIGTMLDLTDFSGMAVLASYRVYRGRIGHSANDRRSGSDWPKNLIMKPNSREIMRSTSSIVFGILFAAAFLPAGQTHAQGLLTMSPEAYQPNSPRTENQLFRKQTGHYGRFYNCDGEESKRSSPHICWKNSHGSQLPFWMGWKERVRQEANQIVQRVIDGSCCGCSGTDCPECQSCEPVPPAECGCNHCLSQHLTSPPNTGMVAAGDSAKRLPAPKIAKAEPRRLFGRVGLISVSAAKTTVPIAAEPTISNAHEDAPQVAQAQPSRSLLTRLRAQSPAAQLALDSADRPQIESVQESVASMSLLDRLKAARPSKPQPAPTRQASAARSSRTRR